MRSLRRAGLTLTRSVGHAGSLVALIAALILTFACSSAAAGAVDVVACGQVIRAGQVGELRQDLDCRTPPLPLLATPGVYLEGGARLDLNGFTIHGDGDGVGVSCLSSGRPRRPCTVNGPGEITGFWAALNGGGCRFVARGLVLRGNTNGIVGPLDCDLKAVDLEVVENAENGIWVSHLHARHLTVSQNGGRGVAAARVDVRGLAAMHNGREGVRQSIIRGRFGRIIDSTVIDNDSGGTGLDIAAAGQLRLRRVRCLRSARLEYPPVVDSSDDQPRIVGSFGCTDD